MNSRMKRSSGTARAAAVTALVSAALVLTSTAAEAAASPCGGGSCIEVTGSRLQVKTVSPQVMVPPLVSYRGHMETWGPGFHVNTSDLWFSNTSYRSWARLTGARYAINRTLPDGAKICSRFWRKNTPGNGKYQSLGTACVTVHR